MEPFQYNLMFNQIDFQASLDGEKVYSRFFMQNTRRKLLFIVQRQKWMSGIEIDKLSGLNKAWVVGKISEN